MVESTHGSDTYTSSQRKEPDFKSDTSVFSSRTRMLFNSLVCYHTKRNSDQNPANGETPPVVPSSSLLFLRCPALAPTQRRNEYHFASLVRLVAGTVQRLDARKKREISVDFPYFVHPQDRRGA